MLEPSIQQQYIAFLYLNLVCSFMQENLPRIYVLLDHLLLKELCLFHASYTTFISASVTNAIRPTPFASTLRTSSSPTPSIRTKSRALC